MPGFDTDSVGGGGTLYATNVDFTGSSFTSGSSQMVANGQLLIGASTNPRIRVNTLTAGTGVSIVNGPGTITVAVTGSGVGQTITGNSGGALSPTAGNWNIFGASTAAGTTPVTTSGSGSTLTVNVQKSQAIASTDATKIGLSNFDSARFTVDANGFVSINGSGIGETITGQSGGALSPTAGNWNISGATTAAGTSPVVTSGSVSTLTVNVQKSQAIASADATKIGLSNFNSAQFTVDANGFVSTSGSGVLNTLTPNSGTTPVVPTGGTISVLGTGSITTVGSLNTLTVELTGLTNHALQIGAGTATLTQLGAGTTGQVLQTNTTADPTWSTATYPSTSTINQLLYSSSNNVIGGLATANNGVLTTGTSGTPVITALASDGQLIIGSSAGAPAAATLSAGTGITITNGHNSITIANTNASGFPWTDVTGATQTLAVNNGYITDHTNVTYTLPASGALGDTMIIVGKLGITTIAQNANQQIVMSSASSTVGATGTVVGTNVGDCITLICITAGVSTVWRANNFVGNWTVS